MLGAGGGCESAVITRGRTAWGKYRDLLPILSSKNVALRTKGRVYMILAFAVLCCMVVKPGPLESQTLTDYSEMKEEFLEEYVVSGRMKELEVQICAGGLV